VTDRLKTGNDMMQQTFLTHQEKEKTWESSRLDLESKYSAQKSELDVEISNLKKDLEKKIENLRKSSESQRTMSARIRELENEQSSLSQQNQRLQDEISEKRLLIEKIRSTPPPPPIVSAPSSEEKRLKDRLTSLERELKLAREKAREFDRLKPIFDEMEMDYSLMKAHRGTYEEAVNALTTSHDSEMSKLTASIAAKDLIIKQQEERMKQMALQNQRALRELGETEKTSIQAVRELERKLQVANYDLSSLRERNKHSEKDLQGATATKEELDTCREEVSSLRNRIELFEKVSNDAVQRLKSVIRKKNELQVQLDGSNALIKRYRSHIGDLSEETQPMVDTTPGSDEESA
jgi:DNA repair exonuclease SbcCD ATPase subunit